MSTNQHENTKCLTASSLSEALHIARQLSEQRNKDVNDTQSDEDKLSCWVAGGEGIFAEALLHPAAFRLHLSVIDKEIQVPLDHSVARFPAKYRWDNKFELKRESQHSANNDGDQLRFVHYVYERIQGRR